MFSLDPHVLILQLVLEILVGVGTSNSLIKLCFENKFVDAGGVGWIFSPEKIMARM